MTRHDQPSALRPEILAASCYVALVAEFERGTFDDDEDPVTRDDLAAMACDHAASFIAEWKRRDPETAAPRFEGQDVPEARGLAAVTGDR